MSNVLQRAADATACQMLNDIGSAGTQLAVWTMWAPKAALVPLTVGALSYMANNLLCPDMEGPKENDEPQLKGCIKLKPGLERAIWHRIWTGIQGSCMPELANEITDVGPIVYSNGFWGNQISYLRADGSPGLYNACVSETEEGAEGAYYYLNAGEGECAGSNDPDDPGDPDPEVGPYNWTDPETNCNYTLKLEGFVQREQYGPAQPVWEISSSGLQSRSDGGRVGGCNLSPTIYVGGSGGGDDGPNGPPNIPVPPVPPPPGPDGEPWWLAPLAGAVAGAILNQIGRIFNSTFNYPMEAGSFDFIAPCNYTEEGENQKVTYFFEEQPLITRLNDHQVAMMEMIQQHLDWKTPICDDTPIPEGDFRTISFRSDETSPYGKSRLRKRFRYRSVSGNDLGAVVDHWKDFVFEGGPYRVRWVGGPWRSPEIWAASEAEGKRVIRHAAAEAGFSPLETGRWSTRLSSSGRQGVPGTMRVDTTKGFYWITARDGSDQRPIVAVT